MRILVTGGAGFIGSNIVDRLVNLGFETIVIDNLSQGKEENINPGVKFYQMDITSPYLKNVFKENEISHVIHHAAQIDVQGSIKRPLNDVNNNIAGTVNLLECCREHGVQKIVYASSAAVYGEPDYLPVDEKHPEKPMSPYGISKHTPEHYIKMYKQLYDLDYVILRYANVYGPRQDPKGEGGVISIFVDQMLSGKKPVIFGDGEQTRDFIYVADIVEANIKALTDGGGELVNISCNTQNTINDIYKAINKILNTDLQAVYQKERKGDIRDSYLDNSRAREILNWNPGYDLYRGLSETINYYTGLKEAAASKGK